MHLGRLLFVVRATDERAVRSGGAIAGDVEHQARGDGHGHASKRHHQREKIMVNRLSVLYLSLLPLIQ